MDEIDRGLLAAMQADATSSYAALAARVGLSAGAAHDRVRKLRERGVIRATTVDVDPDAIGRPILSFVTLDASSWLGGSETAQALRDIPEIEAAHIIAGAGTVMLRVRTESTQALQSVLRRLFELPGVSATHTTVALETIFERPVTVAPAAAGSAETELGSAA